MIERFITAVCTEAPRGEEPAATRERLKMRFPAGAARRMTQLGMLTGAVLGEMNPGGEDAIVYASEFGESRTLEAFLESFPNPSPTLFQTSIHPSGVQQGLIGRQRAVAEVFPFAGAGHVVLQALSTAMLVSARRVLFCGGEERGTWLRELGVASEQTFVFALALEREETEASLGRVAIYEKEGSGMLSLFQWFELLANQQCYEGPIGPGWHLQLAWKKR